MADKQINIQANITNIEKIRKELANLKVNVSFKSDALDKLLKASQKGLEIKVDLKLGKEFKELLELQRKGITIKFQGSGIGAGTSRGARSSKEVFGPFLPEGLASTQRSVAEARAKEIQRLEEVAFRERVNALRNDRIQREKERKLDREQNDRKLQQYFAAQKDPRFVNGKNGVRTNSFSSIDPDEQLFRERVNQQRRRNQQNEKDIAEENARRRAQTDRELKAYFAQQQQKAKANKEAEAFQDKFNKALQGNFTQANSPFFGGFGGPAPAPFSSINPGQQIRVNRLAALQKKLDEKMAAQIEKANKYVESRPLEAFLGIDTKTEASKKFGVGRGAITSNAKFFDANRLRDPENFKNILFTTLLGGKAQGLGAALGTATFDRPGALIGANIAQALVSVFQDISGAMSRATQAGAEYERAITGITGILQATSEVVDQNGQPVSLKQQLSFQGKKAEAIQQASQRALLPLGITGATASALTQSLAAGLAQRGITPDEKSTEILLRRFGASIQTLQPELASNPNLIRRGFEDIIGGGPQASRTELGSALRGIAPALFTPGKKSLEDIIRATDSLEALVEAIKNSDKATIEYQKALGSLQLVQQELGKGILEGLAPGLKSFNEELKKNSTIQSFNDLGKAIGESATSITKLLVPALTGLNGSVAILAKIATGDFGGLAELGGKYFTRNRLDNAPGDEGLAKLNAAKREQGLPEVRRNLNGDLVAAEEISASDRNKVNESLLDTLNKKLFEKGLPIKEYRGGRLVNASSEKQILFARQNINALFSTAKNNYGIENPKNFAEDLTKDSPELKILGIERLRKDLKARASGRNPADVDLEKIGLNVQQIEAIKARQQEREGLFDSSDQGQLFKAQSDKKAIADQLRIAEANLRIRQRILARESSPDIEAGGGKILNGRKVDEEAVAKARVASVKAEEEVLKLRQQGAEKEKEIAQKRLSILQKTADVQDTVTFAGRRAALKARDALNAQERQDLDSQINEAQKILRNPKASETEKQAAQARIEEAKLNKIGNLSKTAQNERDKQQLGLAEVSFALGGPLRRESVADAQKKLGFDQKDLALQAKEVPVELERLAKATRDATKALDDFASDKELRRLGREGEAIAAAEAVVAQGGDVPGNVDASLVRGSSTFDPAARARFERDLAERRFRQTERSNNRANEEERDTETQLSGAKTSAQIAEERGKLQPEQIKLQQRALKRQGIQDAIDAASASLAALQQDPNNPELQKEYADAKARLNKLQQETNTETLPGLGVPFGPPTTTDFRKLPDGRPEFINPDGSPADFSYNGGRIKGEKPGDKERFLRRFPNIYKGIGGNSPLNGDTTYGGATSDYFEGNQDYYNELDKYTKVPGMEDFAEGLPSRKPHSTGFSGPGGLKGLIPQTAYKLSPQEIASLPEDERLAYLNGGTLSPETFKMLRGKNSDFARFSKGPQFDYAGGGGYADADNIPQNIKDAAKLFGFDPTKTTMEFPERIDRGIPSGQAAKGTGINFLKDLFIEQEKGAQGQLLPKGDVEGQLLNSNPFGDAQLIASSQGDRLNYASALFGGIGGSAKFAPVKDSSAKGVQAGADIIRGLIKDRSDTEGRDVNGGASIFDKLEAALPKPLSREDMTSAFAQALNQQFT